MGLIWEGFREAVIILLTLDPLVFGAAWRSLWVSALAMSVAAAVGLPAGSLLARRRFVARGVILTAARAGMAVPTVFIGIVGYALLSRRGPLGGLDLLYSPYAIVACEVFLALPILVSLSHGAVRSLDPRVAQTARTLGANLWRRWWTYISEARVGIILALLTAFARCVTELGVAIMVGGNIKYHTRTLATAIALETGKGEFGRGFAMGLILLTIAFCVTMVIVALTRETEEET